MITKIERVADFRVLQGWGCTSEVPSFKHCNVIYGANGSGKSTLVELIEECAKGLGDNMGARVKQLDLQGQLHTVEPADPLWVRIHVFNQAYIKRNLAFDDAEGATAVPLLQVGEKNIQAEVDRKKIGERLEVLSGEILRAQKNAKKADDQATALLKDTGTKISRELESVHEQYKGRRYKGRV